MKHLRFDRHEIKATRNDDGHLYDTPVLTRVGVFPYRNPDGSTRYELRLPEEVFKQDSLDSLRGVPVTNGHVGKAGKGNTQGNIGAVLSIGRQDGDNLIADIVIHDTGTIDKGNKELSCGYECDLEETAGVWNGQRYDAIQRNIRHNHLAVVPKGRAGNARLNLDATDEVAFFEPENKGSVMKKIRLDNGLEYDVSPEVAVAFDKLKQDVADVTKAKDTAEAQRDVAQADLKKLQDEQPKLKEDALAQAKARVDLENTASAHGVQFKADASDRDIKVAVIGKLRGDALDLAQKSDDYVQAIFDDCVNQKQRADSNAQSQITQTRQDGANVAQSVSASQARANMLNPKGAK